MRARRAVLAALGTTLACTAVNDQFRCGDDRACVLEGRFGGRCEPNGYCSFVDGTCAAERRYAPWSGAYSELCLGEVPTLETPDAKVTDRGNDDPSQPFALTGPEEQVTFDLDGARQDLPVSRCNESGQADLFYRFMIQQPEVVYLDVAGSASGANVNLEVFPGACAVSSGDIAACGDKGCQDGSVQLAQVLQEGSYCLVVSGSGQGVLSFVRGGRTGLPASRGENTLGPCDSPDLTEASCGSTTDTRPETAFYLTACPGQLIVTGSPLLLYVRRGSAFSQDLACQSDSLFVPVGRGLYWLFAELESGCVPGGTVNLSW
jgi:hypothetical protein